MSARRWDKTERRSAVDPRFGGSPDTVEISTTVFSGVFSLQSIARRGT